MVMSDHASGETHNLFWACFEEAADVGRLYYLWVAANSTEQQAEKNPSAPEIEHYITRALLELTGEYKSSFLVGSQQ